MIYEYNEHERRNGIKGQYDCDGLIDRPRITSLSYETGEANIIDMCERDRIILGISVLLRSL